MSKPLRRRRGPVYWFIEEFKLFENGKPRFAIRLMMFIASLFAAGFVACAVFKLC